MAMRDPYDVLGVPRDADADTIKKAYRKLAKQYHPDLNPGDAGIERKFKDVSVAHDLLSDPEKRARFDRGEIDASGAERPMRGRRGPHPGADSARARGGAGAGPGAGFGGFGAGINPDDLFDEILRGGARRGFGGAGAGFNGGASSKRRGADINFSVTVDFIAAAAGNKRRLTLPDQRTVDITIPPGTEEGTQLRLAGQGQPGINGGPAGDAYIEVQIEPHPLLSRQGRDILLTLPITLPEAVLGGAVTVPTIEGKVAVKIPKGANSGTTLRLRGKGLPATKTLPAGDQLVKLVVTLPDVIDGELTSFMERWSRAAGYDVRRKAGFDA